MIEAMAKAGHENIESLTEAIERRMSKGGTRFKALVDTYLHEAHLVRTEDGCVVAALSSEMTRQTNGGEVKFGKIYFSNSHGGHALWSLDWHSASSA